MIKNRISILLLFLTIHSAVMAQADIAAQEKKLAGAAGKERLALLIDLGIAYSQSDVKKSMARGKEALVLAQKLGDAARGQGAPDRRQRLHEPGATGKRAGALPRRRRRFPPPR